MKSLLDGHVGSYTETQLEAALRAPSSRIGCRFEVFDLHGQQYDDLTTVIAATVDTDATRLVESSLRLSFAEADPVLPFDTTVPFTRLIKPWLQLGMPDGGYVEWPQGVYVWPQPTRKILSVDPFGESEPVAAWEATCGDQTTFLVFGGPGQIGWNISPHTATTAAIGATLTAAMPYPVSLAGIVDSDKVTAGPLSWMLFSSANPPPGGTVGGAPANSWATILQTLHNGAGYTPTYWDWTGQYVAKPMPVYNLFSQDPVWREKTDRKSIVEVPIDSVPQLDKIGNRVFVKANNANAHALQGVARADANDWLPDHPYAQKNCGIYMDVVDTDGVAGEYQALQAAATSLLFQRMAKVCETSFVTQALPHLEPWDVIGLQVPGDPTYGTMRRLMTRAWSLDLFSGRMTHKPASITGG